jgi:uncharacterized protein YwgA
VNEHPENTVADLVAAAGGKLISRVRLQKLAYLLDQKGAHTGFGYTYHHFGPYSRELEAAIYDAGAFALVTETFEHRALDGARYSVFTVKDDAARHEFAWLRDEGLRALAKRLSTVNVTVLELAATAHWLAEKEQVEDWRSEIKRRKKVKASDGRLDEAERLLRGIGLPPAVRPSAKEPRQAAPA